MPRQPGGAGRAGCKVRPSVRVSHATKAWASSASSECGSLAHRLSVGIAVRRHGNTEASKSLRVAEGRQWRLCPVTWDRDSNTSNANAKETLSEMRVEQEVRIEESAPIKLARHARDRFFVFVASVASGRSVHTSAVSKQTPCPRLLARWLPPSIKACRDSHGRKRTRKHKTHENFSGLGSCLPPSQFFCTHIHICARRG
eukprot:355289-Chlamydomonas_euryale.AAC.2